MPKRLPFQGSNDDFGQRLRHWRIRKDMIQAEAAQILKINRGYYSQVELGRRPAGLALRTRFHLLENTLPPLPGFPHGERRSAGLRRIPVLSWLEAGQVTDLERMPTDAVETIPSDLADEHAFGVRLRGDSMEPKFSEGDIALLLPGAVATNGEIVVANVRDQGVLCKIMHVQLDKQLVKLSSYNPAYPPTEYHRDEFHWIHPVSAIIKQLRPR